MEARSPNVLFAEISPGDLPGEDRPVPLRDGPATLLTPEPTLSEMMAGLFELADES